MLVGQRVLDHNDRKFGPFGHTKVKTWESGENIMYPVPSVSYLQRMNLFTLFFQSFVSCE